MQVLDFRMNDDLLFAAYGFSNFRENVKKYLEKTKCVMINLQSLKMIRF